MLKVSNNLRFPGNNYFKLDYYAYFCNYILLGIVHPKPVRRPEPPIETFKDNNRHLYSISILYLLPVPNTSQSVLYFRDII